MASPRPGAVRDVTLPEPTGGGVLPEDTVPGEAQQCGQQCQRDKHGDEHDGRGGEAHVGEELDVRQGQTDECDDDRQSGEDHRGPGGADRQSDRVGSRSAVAQFVPEPAHDEQGIVDADGQADHDAENRGDVVQRDEGGRPGDTQCAQAHTDDGGDQRQPGGEHRPEGEDQDDEGDDDADDLTDRLDLDGVTEARATGLGLQPGVAGDLQRVGHRVLVGGGDVGRQLDVKGETGGAGRPVRTDEGDVRGICLGDLLRQAHLRLLPDEQVSLGVIRGDRAGEGIAGLVGHRGDIVLHRGDRLVHRGGDLRVGERLPLRCLVDQGDPGVLHRVLGAGELVHQHLGGVLGGHTVDGEEVVVPLLERRGEATDHHEDAEPHHEDELAVEVGPATEAEEESCHGRPS